MRVTQMVDIYPEALKYITILYSQLRPFAYSKYHHIISDLHNHDIFIFLFH